MGFLAKLVTLPITGPIQGVLWIAGKINEQVENELYDEGKVRGQLLELEMRYDLGEIDEEEYLSVEEALLQRLKEIRERQAAAGET
jgi:hypothetical protein